MITVARPYTFCALEADTLRLLRQYPFLKHNTIGKSVEGKPLHAFILGKGKTRLLYNGAHHGLEWITSLLLMRFIEDYCTRLTDGGRDIIRIFDTLQLHVIPQVNPDGVNLAVNGINRSNPYHLKAVSMLQGTDPTRVWQANINGVDLNHNYDASFEEGVKYQRKLGIYMPAPTRYCGLFPESEPESRALAGYTRRIAPHMVVAYHSQGEVIYWNYNNLASCFDKEIACIFSKKTGYALDETEGIASFSGYKDWFIKVFRRPGLTVEVGCGINPLPLFDFEKIYRDNQNAMFNIGLHL